MPAPYLDPTYQDPAGPFKDNSAGAITAGTLRAFATGIETGLETVAAAGGGSGLPETPLAVEHGGTGATAAAAARANLGITGVGLAPRGGYDNAATYNPGDVVSQNGTSYVLGGATTSIGVAPPTSPWNLLAAKGDAATLTFGSTAGTAAEGNDTRLSNPRTPLDGSVTDAKIAATLSPSKITGTAVVTADGRLSDQRVPLDTSVTAAKIAASAVTNTKLAAMASKTIKGNAGGGSAAPADLTADLVAAVLSGVMAAIGVTVDTSAGLQPTVQESLQACWDAANTAPTFL